MAHDRRSVLATIGLALPFGLGPRLTAATPAAGPVPALRFRPFEEAVREAFASGTHLPSVTIPGEALCHRIEIGHAEELLMDVQGCCNDRPFAGFPAGHLRIVRFGSGPGSIVHGVRLYVATVDVALVGAREGTFPGRPLNFALIPPAPILVAKKLADNDNVPGPERDRRGGE
ncbi:hypothetical protein VT84_02975 [Gemmata sp. SH-PL17]|uniref:hypothetical protein n=1 Tax=Gemmata sp. SH-PL17 TaxID=1630693 RepID=UPI00078E6DCD|nr:hypothetical protein [Gemmata sp. SH-PL17]AMV23344.1 hypothetical protein VT84_02975 [Gemmata sp. SH-PL17]